MLVLLMLTLPDSFVIAQGIAPEAGRSVAWSPDGLELAVFARNGVFVYSREFSLLQHADVYGLGRIGWSPDGTRLLVANQILDASALDVVIEMEGFPRGWLYERSQVFGITINSIYRRDAVTGNLLETFPISVQLEEVVASPDGTHIVSAVADKIHVFDVADGSMITYTLPHSTVVYSHVWSPDGTGIAFTSTRVVPRGTLGSIETIDGAILYTLQVLDVITGELLRTSAPLSFLASLTWSEQGNLLAGVSACATLNFWNAETLDSVASYVLPTDISITGSLDFSPDGELLAVGISPQAQTYLLDSATLHTFSMLEESTVVAGGAVLILPVEQVVSGQ